jgi:glyoxylase-like metal-dependent hydrolase (beta-lactamase superfamily II)
MKVHAQPKRLTAPLPGGEDGAAVVVEPLLGGEVQGPRAIFERPGGPLETVKVAGLFTPRSDWWTVPCPVFLITHPAVGPMLVDTGLHPSVAASARENMGPLWERFARPRVEPGRDVPAQLRERGIEPRELRLVVMTHLHQDHASGISEFPNSTFVVSAPEWHAATTDRRPLLRGYRPAHYDYVFDYRTVDYEGPGIASYSTFGRTFDLFGDGSLRLAFTPGHSAGHQSVIARLRDRDFVIAGDAIYTRGQLDDAPEPPRPVDRHTWRRSRQELALFARQYPQALIVPGHDPDDWATLDSRYE